MANIFGTILSVGDFLKKDEKQIKIIRGDETDQKFILSENRKYIIPDYQREIRWSKENLIELISDLSSGNKFLGNIILNKCSSSEYEVIDGQQRITALLMIIYYIRSKFNQELDILETCELKIVNFDKFDIFINKKFDIDSCSPSEKKLIEDSDVFNQRKRYKELWDLFSEIDKLQTKIDCFNLLRNLRQSEFNLIANIVDTDNSSIGYFLDVNLKGVKLDAEDIFKGYLFSLDTSSAIRDEWKTFKILSFKLNSINHYYEKHPIYPVTKLIEHYLYCNLYKIDKYKDIEFKEDFTINKVDIGNEHHYSGEHIVNVIQDNTFMLNSFKNINKFLTIVFDIVETGDPSQKFKNLFSPSANIDNVEKTIIHNFIGKIMRDTNVVPKILMMKYIIEVLFDPTNKNKEDYRKIYGVYLLAVLFTVFESDKNIKKVLSVVKDIDWYIKTVDQAKSYFSRSKISKSRITAQYKIVEPDEIEDYMFRCKSLATIYNFFEIKDDKVRIIHGKMNDLKEYVSNSERFSDEHFIINNSGNLDINGNTKAYSYSPEIKKYANSIFNFIFICRELNDELGNFALSKKISILDRKVVIQSTLIECDFSKMIIEVCKTDFAGLMNLTTVQAIDNFYQNDFIQTFDDYALDVIKKIGEKLGVA